MSPASSQSSGTFQAVSTLATKHPGPSATTFSPFSKKVRLYGTLPLCPTIHASGLSCPCGAPAVVSFPTGVPPNRPLFLRSFFSFPTDAVSTAKVGVPGRLLKGDDVREETSKADGGSRGSRSAADSTGWMVGFESETWRGDFGAGGGGYSGVRCVAEDMRWRTLVSRELDSDGVGLGFVFLLSDESEDPDENRLDNRWLDFFLSPNIASVCS